MEQAESHTDMCCTNTPDKTVVIQKDPVLSTFVGFIFPLLFGYLLLDVAWGGKI